MVSKEPKPEQASEDLGEMIRRASRQAMQRAIRLHIALDVPMVEWHDSEVRIVAPNDARLQSILTEYSAN